MTELITTHWKLGIIPPQNVRLEGDLKSKCVQPALQSSHVG